MVSCCPLRIGLFPFQMASLWLIDGGDPNYLLTGMAAGMALQAS